MGIDASLMGVCCVQAEWTAKRQAVLKEHQEALDQAALPLRTFLMKHIMPTLTEGLMQVCKSRPEDPIDFLAEFLFQNNPQID
jgi:adenylate kinase